MKKPLAGKKFKNLIWKQMMLCCNFAALNKIKINKIK